MAAPALAAKRSRDLSLVNAHLFYVALVEASDRGRVYGLFGCWLVLAQSERPCGGSTPPRPASPFCPEQGLSHNAFVYFGRILYRYLCISLDQSLLVKKFGTAYSFVSMCAGRFRPSCVSHTYAFLHFWLRRFAFCKERSH